MISCNLPHFPISSFPVVAGTLNTPASHSTFQSHLLISFWRLYFLCRSANSVFVSQTPSIFEDSYAATYCISIIVSFFNRGTFRNQTVFY